MAGIGLALFLAVSAARAPKLCPVDPPAGVFYTWDISYESADGTQKFTTTLVGGPAAKPIIEAVEAGGQHVTWLSRQTVEVGIVTEITGQ